MALQRYDIPVGTITHIIHRVQDVTEFVRSGRRAADGAKDRLSEP
jgi:hypothetical protein